MELSLSSDPFRLQNVQESLSTLTRSRTPQFLAKLQKAQEKKCEIHAYKPHATRNRIFAAVEALIDEFVESKPLLGREQLCSLCEKYTWAIPHDADYLRETQFKNKEQRQWSSTQNRAFSGLALLNNLDELQHYIEDDNVPSKESPKAVWRADITLPSGSLFQLLTRPSCRICMLVLHLLSPLPIKSFLAWALDQPLATLHGIQYMMEYQRGERIMVRSLSPGASFWHAIGNLETFLDDDQSSDRSMAWRSSNLSKRTHMNSSWVRSTVVDVPLIQSWLGRCDATHVHCATIRSLASQDATMKIRLVDVEDYCIVDGKLSDQYFALSYVWGGVKRLVSSMENIQTLRQKGVLKDRAPSIPRSVLDAIKLVAKLGYRYLWVDSLCIVQDMTSEKHDQVAMMHKIYSAAYATIVQQSGSDANAGLPGVRPGTRSFISTKTRVGDHVMMATANHSLPRVLSSSIHSTRGWTLQEVLMSTRCLHFFNKQLTFVCGEEWAQDWNARTLALENTDEVRLWANGQNNDIEEEVKGRADEIFRYRKANQPTRVALHMLWQINPLYLTRAIEGKEWDTFTLGWLRHFEIYGRILTDYTYRHLSFESDALPAFGGLSGAITRLNGTRFFYGLPANSFDLALLWINLGPGERRRFENGGMNPSWSWAGWMGQTTYNLCRLNGQPSEAHAINSFVKRFCVVESHTSVEITRERPIVPNVNLQSRTPYFEARYTAKEPRQEDWRIQDLPNGCLHFWAEESSMTQFRFGSHVERLPFLFTRNDDKRSGILALPQSLRAEAMGNREFFDDGYALLLMSETPQTLVLWDFEDRGALSRKATMSGIGQYGWDSQYFDGAKWRSSWMFNVLLVKRSENGRFVERVAFGQVHMLAWLTVERRRRYARIL